MQYKLYTPYMQLEICTFPYKAIHPCIGHAHCTFYTILSDIISLPVHSLSNPHHHFLPPLILCAFVHSNPAPSAAYCDCDPRSRRESLVELH